MMGNMFRTAGTDTYLRLKQPSLWIAIVFVTLYDSLTGPFGTYEYVTLKQIIFFWLPKSALVVASATFLIEVSRSARFRHKPYEYLGLFLAYAVLMGALSILIVSQIKGENYLQKDTPLVFAYAFVMTMIFLYSIRYMFNYIDALMCKREASVRPKIFSRLKKHRMANTVFALSANDHYVRVYSELGEELCHLSFAEAVKEIDPIAGIRVHRSHWVALEAIKETNITSGRGTVKLKNDVKLPLSRAGVKEINDLNERRAKMI